MKVVRGYLVGIFALCHITKVDLFQCDNDSVFDSLRCNSGKCCTPQDNVVMAAEVTDTNNLCLSGTLHHLSEELPNKKCVSVSGWCRVTLSYCYLKERPSSVSLASSATTVAGSSSTTPLEHVSNGPKTSQNTSISIHEAVTSGVQENTESYSSISMSETSEGTVSSLMIHTSDKNDEDNKKLGVIAGASVAFLALIIFSVAILLVIRIRRKRTETSATTDASKRVITFSNRDSLPSNGLSTDTTYSAVDKGNRTKVTEQNPILALRNSFNYYNVQCAVSNEESAYDSTDLQPNHAVIEDAYDHTVSTVNSHVVIEDPYDHIVSTVNSHVVIDEAYDHTFRIDNSNTNN